MSDISETCSVGEGVWSDSEVKFDDEEVKFDDEDDMEEVSTFDYAVSKVARLLRLCQVMEPYFTPRQLEYIHDEIATCTDQLPHHRVIDLAKLQNRTTLLNEVVRDGLLKLDDDRSLFDNLIRSHVYDIRKQ